LVSMKRTARWQLANQTCSEVSMRGCAAWIYARPTIDVVRALAPATCKP
jgi:hypothetical protein